MKHPYFRLGSTLLLSSLLGFYSPAYADEEKAAGEAETDAIELEYEINEGETQTATGNMNQPFKVLLDILKASIAEASEEPNSLVDTEIMLPYPEDMTESLDEENLPNLDLVTRVGDDGKGSTQFSIAAFESEIEGEDTEGKLTWMGLSGNMTYTGNLESPTADFKAPGLFIDMGEEGGLKMEALSLSGTMNQYFEPLKMDFKLPTLSFISEEADFIIDSLTAKVDLEEKIEGLQLGTAEIKLKELKVDAEEKVALKDFSISSDGQMQSEDLVKYLTKFNIGQITLPEEAQKAMGGLNDLKLQLDIELSNINAATIADIHKTVRQLQAQGMNQEMMGFALMSKLMEASTALLPKSPQIAIQSLQVNTNQGDLKGHLNLSYDGKQPLNMQNPAQMIQALLGDTKMQISKALLKRVITEQVRSEMPEEAGDQAPKPEDMADMQIQAFVQQKFLVDTGDTYTLEANMKAGKLMLNGQEMPLPF